MKAGLVIAAALLATGVAPVLHARAEVKGAHFAPGNKGSKALLRTILDNASPEVGFNEHYLISAVSCGAGCLRFWLIDVRNGSVFRAPNLFGPGEAPKRIFTKPGTDTLWVLYGPKDGSNRACTAQRYKMYRTDQGTIFRVIGLKTVVDCSTRLE